MGGCRLPRPHLRLRYLPNLTEYFDRPAATFQAAIQRRRARRSCWPRIFPGLYAILENSNHGTGEGSINGMLIDPEDGRYASIVMGCAFIGGFVDGTFDHLC